MPEQAMTAEERSGAEAAIRRALVKDIKRWEALVREANEICRSAHEIAARRGADTNWDAFTKNLELALKNQHAALHPKPEPDEGYCWRLWKERGSETEKWNGDACDCRPGECSRQKIHTN